MPRRTERDILEKKISTQLSQEAWVGVNTNSKRPGLVARKRRVSRERWAEWLSSRTQISTPTAGGVEFLQEGNELAAPVALSDGVVDNAGHEIDGCREGHSSKPLVFM